MANIFRLYFDRSETYYVDVEANTLDEAIAKEAYINASDMHKIDGTMECVLDEEYTRNNNQRINYGTKIKYTN